MVAGLNDVEALVSGLNLGPQLFVAVIESTINLDAILFFEGLGRKIRTVDTPGPDVELFVFSGPNTPRWE
jgi:hypothetical protein